MSDQPYPRRGTDWDVFEAGGELCIQVIDESDNEDLLDDEAATEYVLCTASRPPDDCPDEVVKECRKAVREIVASWPKAKRVTKPSK